MSALRSGLRAFAEEHLGGTGLVLIYHRVAELERDPQLLSVTPEHFDAQMAILEAARVIPLEELLAGLHRGRAEDGAIAITFDDGYADNLTGAEPILAARGLPATVFVSSGYASTQREFWWDEVERLLLGPSTLPERLVLEAESVRFERDTGEAASYSEEQSSRDRGWNVLLPPNARQQLYLDVCAFVRPLTAAAQRSVLDQLSAAAGLAQLTRPTHRPLDVAEVAELDASAVVRVGAHSADHLLLGAHPGDVQRAQIASDKDVLAGICGRAIETFSYPFGAFGDYDATTVSLVRGAGFAGACANHPGVVKPWTDPFLIPRMLVRDWDAETFERTLGGWFRGR